MAEPNRIQVLLAPNAFKGTLSAHEVCSALAAGVSRAVPEARVVCLPLADGGDGFRATLVAAAGGWATRHRVSGPLGEPIRAAVGWLPGSPSPTAVIELAAADGLARIGRPSPKTAADASTRGLGALIRAALARGPAQILVGLGGSASTDGGAGMARALGYRFLRSDGSEIPEGGGGLGQLHHIVAEAVDWRLAAVPLLAACDVTNPLLGPSGAAAVYAPQKGADQATVALLEAGLGRLAEVAARDLGSSGMEAEPGSGAAGGTGFGLLAFCRARLTPGAILVANELGLDGQLAASDLVLTGEGRFDLASLTGKAPGEVARRARRAGVPCVVIAGSSAPGAAAALGDLGASLLETGGEIDALAGADPRTLAGIRRRSRAALARAAFQACAQTPLPRAPRRRSAGRDGRAQ